MANFDRRRFLRKLTAGALATGTLGTGNCHCLPVLADDLNRQSAAGPPRPGVAQPRRPQPRRQCVLLWMTGGPSQTDTFDLKPGHANGGSFQPIATSVPGLQVSEHLPGLAKQAERLALVRGLSTKEGDHGRGTYLMRTGRQPMGPVRYPAIGAAVAKELAGGDDAVHYVSVAPYRLFNPAAFGPGFLGAKYGPLTVGENGNGLMQAAASPAGTPYAELRVDDLQAAPNVSPGQGDSRWRLWRTLQSRFLAAHPNSASAASHDMVYQKARQLMDSDVVQAFDLSRESSATREAYGRGRFGQGCLMARRLLERGVSFVEVTLGSVSDGALGWDTHLNNFPAVKALSAELDAGWSTLMSELADRGLLESTTFLWLGEFGRTPKINNNAGRDHFPAAWTCVFAGGGIRGGQAYGRTSDGGEEVVEGKVDVGDVLATLCAALGLPPDHENISEVGRPIKLADGQPIREILTT